MYVFCLDVLHTPLVHQTSRSHHCSALPGQQSAILPYNIWSATLSTHRQADPTIAASFFAGLTREPPGARAAVQEALGVLAGAYQAAVQSKAGDAGSTGRQLEELLATSIKSDQVTGACMQREGGGCRGCSDCTRPAAVVELVVLLQGLTVLYAAQPTRLAISAVLRSSETQEFRLCAHSVSTLHHIEPSSHS
jgi:hypothetical protein